MEEGSVTAVSNVYELYVKCNIRMRKLCAAIGIWHYSLPVALNPS